MLNIEKLHGGTSNINNATSLSHLFAVLLYPVENTIASKEPSFPPSNSIMLPLTLVTLLWTYKILKIITFHMNLQERHMYILNKETLTFILPFLIKPTVPTSITADRPVSDLMTNGPFLGLVMPCLVKSPNMKFAIITRRSSTSFSGIWQTSVIPNRINSFVIICICNHKKGHTSFTHTW